MTKRLQEIYSALPSCSVFADIGCDHGYVAKAMLDGGKCQKAIISDVSKKCLEKAENLLSDYMEKGVCESVVSDGFERVGKCDLALIAGMGGEEIIGIIKRATFLPENLVLQPMKNVDKVRLCAVKTGYRIVKDYCFKDLGKYYDLIVLTRGKDSLTKDEIEFGRTNILERKGAFLERNALLLDRYEKLLADHNINPEEKSEIRKKAENLKNYV